MKKLRSLFNQKVPKPLTRVDVSHLSVTDPGVIWLMENGFRPKPDMVTGRVYMVKPC